MESTALMRRLLRRGVSIVANHEQNGGAQAAPVTGAATVAQATVQGAQVAGGGGNHTPSNYAGGGGAGGGNPAGGNQAGGNSHVASRVEGSTMTMIAGALIVIFGVLANDYFLNSRNKHSNTDGGMLELANDRIEKQRKLTQDVNDQIAALQAAGVPPLEIARIVGGINSATSPTQKASLGRSGKAFVEAPNKAEVGDLFSDSIPAGMVLWISGGEARVTVNSPNGVEKVTGKLFKVFLSDGTEIDPQAVASHSTKGARIHVQPGGYATVITK